MIALSCGRTLLTTALTVAASVSLAFAEESVSVDTILATALTQSVRAKSADAEATSKLAEALALETRLNPELETEFRSSTRLNGANETEVKLSLPLRTSDFGLRKQVSETLEALAKQDKSLAFLELTQQIRGLAAELWIAQETGAQALASRRIAERTLKLIRSASANGLLPKSESQLFSAQVGVAKTEALHSAGLKKKLTAALLKLSGFNLGERSLQRPSIKPLPSNSELARLLEGQQSPMRERNRLALSLAKQQQELAKKDSTPVFAPALVYGHTDDGEDQIGVGFSMGLPLFDRNRAQILDSEAKLAAEAANESYTSGESFNQHVLGLADSARNLEEQISIYETEVLPPAREAVESYDTQFKTGQSGIAQAWQAQTMLIEAQSKLMSLRSEYFTARAELSLLVGSDI